MTKNVTFLAAGDVNAIPLFQKCVKNSEVFMGTSQ